MARWFEDIRDGWPRRVLCAAVVSMIVAVINLLLTTLVVIIWFVPVQGWLLRVQIAGLFLVIFAFTVIETLHSILSGTTASPGQLARRYEKPVRFWIGITIRLIWVMMFLGAVLGVLFW